MVFDEVSRQPRTEQCGACNHVEIGRPAGDLLSGDHTEAVSDIMCLICLRRCFESLQGSPRKCREFQEFNEQPSPGACVV